MPRNRYRDDQIVLLGENSLHGADDERLVVDHQDSPATDRERDLLARRTDLDCVFSRNRKGHTECRSTSDFGLDRQLSPHVGDDSMADGQAKASSPIEYAAQLTETMLLGLVALRAGQGKRILYDGERGQITNIADANQYLTRDYREGWAI
jgi:hypothetical protein